MCPVRTFKKYAEADLNKSLKELTTGVIVKGIVVKSHISRAGVPSIMGELG